MGVIPDKVEYKRCGEKLANRFFELLGAEPNFTRVTFHPASDISHFVRYGYLYNSRKVSVVYDIKADMLSVTSFDDATPILNRLYHAAKVAVGQSQQSKPAQNSSQAQPQKQPQANRQTKPQSRPQANMNAPTAKNGQDRQQRQAAVPQVSGQSKANAAPSTNTPAASKPAADKKLPAKPQPQSQKPAPKQSPTAKPQPQPQKAQPQKPAAKTAPPETPKPAETENQGGLTLKKFSPKQFEALSGKIKKQKQLKCKEEPVFEAGKPTEIRTFTVSGEGQKVKLRYMPVKQIVQLQGKPGGLFASMRMLLSEDADYKEAVTAHVEMNRDAAALKTEDVKISNVERRLKKLMPSAMRYLSEQARIDFSIGIVELMTSTVEHYDYSMLLLPPFRGLERLISDLQRAQGIDVKMIGQAYEKEEGVHVLKKTYRRRINSVVYAEVMSALYREYSSTRNFYAHSDNSAMSGGARMLQQRGEAAAIFEKMMALIDYNCKKLTEINFSI